MKLLNASSDSIVVITDVRLAGQSMMQRIRAACISTGRLEDAEDRLTVVPGESITLDCDEVDWVEL